MSKHRATWFAWTIWALALAIESADVVVSYTGSVSGLLSSIFTALVALAFPTVGALIISRRPENLIGWLLSCGMLLESLGGFALDYAVYTLLQTPHPLPGGEWMLWLGGWTRSLGFFLLIAFVPLYFPTGKVPSPRWRTFARVAGAEAALFTLVNILSPTNQAELRLPPLPNPLGIIVPDAIGGPVSGIAFFGYAAVTLLGIVSLVVRFRHSKGEERQQIKWFALAGVFAAVLFAFLFASMMLLPADIVRNFGVLFELALGVFPVAAGIAILRYHLYDIDLIIRRTLVYSVLTVLLALFYLGSVVVLQGIFRALTGQQSDLAIVISTLAIAALFLPLRGRIQQLIDRRFYRRKYDAQKVLAAFGAAARDEVDLNRLTDELVAVVQETVQPASVSLWIKKGKVQ